MLFSLHFANFFIHFFPNRWASFPSNSVHACQPGREDHGHAAGDRQLWAATHAGVSRITAFKGASFFYSILSPWWHVWHPYAAPCQHSCLVSCLCRWKKPSLCYKPIRQRKMPLRKWAAWLLLLLRPHPEDNMLHLIGMMMHEESGYAYLQWSFCDSSKITVSFQGTENWVETGKESLHWLQTPDSSQRLWSNWERKGKF